jgi:hypothetical protein
MCAISQDAFGAPEKAAVRSRRADGRAADRDSLDPFTIPRHIDAGDGALLSPCSTETQLS